MRNMRFNESLIALLGNLDAIGRQAAFMRGSRGRPHRRAAAAGEDFTFSSRSSGI